MRGKKYDTAVVRAEKAEYAFGTTKATLAVTSAKQAKDRSMGMENTPVSITPKRSKTSPGDGRLGGSKKHTRQDTTNAVPMEMRSSSATSQENKWSQSVDRRK